MPGALNLHETAILLPSASYGVGAHNVTYRRDHHSGLYILIDVTNVGAGPGTIQVRARLRSNVNGAHSVVLWTANALINAVGTYAYLWLPQGLENLGAGVPGNEGETERIALPLPDTIAVETTVAVNAITYGIEAIGIAL